VHYVVMGEGPDLVLIHGSSGNTRDFTLRFAGRLADRYRVIVIDRPGLGYTDRDRPAYGGSLAAQARRNWPMQAARSSVRSGPSSGSFLWRGGGAGLGTGAARQVAGWCFLGASNPWDTGLATYYTASPGWAALRGPVADRPSCPTAPWISRSPPSSAATAPPGYHADHIGVGLTLRRVSMRANALQVNLAWRASGREAPRYGEIDVPVEIVHGTADTIVGSTDPFRAAVPAGCPARR
jgi:pimeloyl-ACP methyl ester carboxylesterase